MSNFSTAITEANEIVKAVDFTFANDQAIKNIAVAMKGILANGALDLVIGGAVSPYASGGMNVTIDPIFAHCGQSGFDVVDTEMNQPVSVEAADVNLDRIDIIQVRGIEEGYDYQNRKYRDPETGIRTTHEVATKKRIKLDIMVKRGTNGSVAAPLADTGYVKLAEISVPAGTVSITAENIKNITARFALAPNTAWTNEPARTFNPGYLTDIVGKFLADHTETGVHKPNVIKAAMIKFGNGEGDVNGAGIPAGQSVAILGQNYNALSAIAHIIEALASAVNLAYPYSNNLLGRYALLDIMPVAASTENIDITSGGEQIIDGVTCSTGQMVFLKDQTDSKQNGFYEVQSGQWNRYMGYTNATPDALNGKFIAVMGGTVNGGKVFYLDGDYKIGTDSLNFKENIFSPQAIPGKTIIRDTHGRAQVAAPGAAADIARKAEVDAEAEARAAADALKAPLANPAFTGTPTVPSKTGAPANDGTLIATEAQVYAEAEARADADALKAPLNSPVFTGTPKVPSKTAAAANDGTLIATEAQVYAKANLASPIFTGNPTIQHNISGETVKNYRIASISDSDVMLERSYPIGSYALTNAGKTPYTNSVSSLYVNEASGFNFSSGTSVFGTWRACGNSNASYCQLWRRVA
jgi:hypothetical protein